MRNEQMREELEKAARAHSPALWAELDFMETLENADLYKDAGKKRKLEEIAKMQAALESLPTMSEEEIAAEIHNNIWGHGWESADEIERAQGLQVARALKERFPFLVKGA